MREQSRQWKGKTGGGKFGQKSLFFLLRKIPVCLFYPVLFPIIPFYMLFGRQRYKFIMRYFKQCYSLSTGKAFFQTFRNYIIFGQIVLDKFAVVSGNIKQFSIESSGKAYFDELMAKDTGFIIASSHIGNFEFAGFFFHQSQKRLHALIYGEESQEMQKTRTEAMKDANIHAVSVKNDMSHLFILKQALETGEIVTIACDRIFGSAKTVTCNFMGQNARFPLAPFRLAVQMNVPVVSLFVMKSNYNTYHAHIIPVEITSSEQNSTKKAEHLAVKFVQNCEDIVRKYPLQWFNYYDFWNTSNEIV